MTPAQGREKLELTKDGKIAAFLWKTLWARHKGTLLASLALQGVYSAFNFAGPVILNKIVTFLQNWAFWRAEQSTPLVRVPYRWFGHDQLRKSVRRAIAVLGSYMWRWPAHKCEACHRVLATFVVHASEREHK